MKTQSKQRTIIWLLVLVLAVPGPASAVATEKGRLIGKVVDPDGNPVDGVTVTASCDELPDYSAVETTNKKGIFKLDFSKIYVTYALKFKKNGYYSFTSEEEWNKDGTERLDFIMHPGEDVELSDVPLASTSIEAIDAFNTAVLAYKDGDLATSESKFLESLQFDPQLHQAWAALTHVYLRQEKYEQTVEAAEKAIEFGTTDQAVYRSRWEAIRHIGTDEEEEQALKDLEKAGLRIEEARRVHNEAVALMEAGDDAAAFERFHEALRVDPNLAPLLGIATTGIKIGKYAEAADAAEKVLNGNPKNVQAARALYNACLELDDKDRLVTALVGLAPFEHQVARDGLLQLALDAYYDASDMELAKKRFTKVLSVDPDEPYSHYYLGLLNVQAENNAEARKHLERFIELAAEHPEAPNAQEILSYLKE